MKLTARSWGSAAIAAAAASFLGACSQGESAKEHADRNKDGRISTQELDRALTEAVFYKCDMNGNGRVSFGEWKEAFPDADKEKFMSAAPHTGAFALDDVVEYVQENQTWDVLIAKIDVDRNGIIDEREAAVFYETWKVAEGATDVAKLKKVADE